MDGDDFDVGGDVVCPAKVEHFLSLRYAADVRAGQAAAAEDLRDRRLHFVHPRQGTMGFEPPAMPIDRPLKNIESS